MTRPAEQPVLVLGRAVAAERGGVIGVFEILDLQLRTVTVGVLCHGEEASAGTLAVGRYFARASLASGRQCSRQFDVAAGTAPVVVVLEDPGDGAAAAPNGSGWAAGWLFDVASGRFAPAPPESLRTAGTTMTLSGAAATGNALIQWAVDGQAALFSAAPAGWPVRFGSDAPAVTVEPGSSTAAALMAFLHAGNVPAARTLAADVLAGAGPSDPATAVAVGYCLLRYGDPRLGAWARDLARSQPESFDARLIHACALMRDADGWRDARSHLLAATRYGLPLYTPGLRLLDDGLRLLGEDDELTAARRRFVPYLRSCLDRALTTFWGADPATPTPRPGVVAAPAHARLMRLDRLRPVLRPPALTLVEPSAVRPASPAAGLLRGVCPTCYFPGNEPSAASCAQCGTTLTLTQAGYPGPLVARRAEAPPAGPGQYRHLGYPPLPPVARAPYPGAPPVPKPFRLTPIPAAEPVVSLRRRPRVLWQIMGAVVALLVVGTVVAVVELTGGNPQGPPIAGVTTVTPTRGSAADPRTQAAAVDALLDAGISSRTKLNAAIDLVNNCTLLERAIGDMQTVGSERQSQIDSVSRFDLSAIPEGEQVRSMLKEALGYSLAADRSFVSWGQARQSSECGGGQADYEEAQRQTLNSGAAKTRFVDVWNPVASRYGLRTRSSNDI
ncbi:hypothetical protein ACPPVO_45350 [Dactylosporangium sp. McL0621]|uniref:hypothetical protein n=1 Tax=Dactylosporangium sp. McL0621 TaxID=3415678 RepID=UPI003CEBF934